jgi:hypothetical protein
MPRSKKQKEVKTKGSINLHSLLTTMGKNNLSAKKDKLSPISKKKKPPN